MVATGKNSEEVEPKESRSVFASQSEKSDCVEDQVRMCGADARDDRAGPSSLSEIADSDYIRGLNIEKEKPYHPNASSLPKQYLPERTLAFQDSWFSAFPWLHWDAEKDKLLCFYCRIFYDEKTSHLGKKSKLFSPNTVLAIGKKASKSSKYTKVPTCMQMWWVRF